MRPNREYHRAVERELADWPGVSHRLESGSKHPRLILSFAGAERFVCLPTTSSDTRGGGRDAMIATGRQTLRALGATRTPHSAPKRRLREFTCAGRPSPV